MSTGSLETARGPQNQAMILTAGAALAVCAGLLFGLSQQMVSLLQLAVLGASGLAVAGVILWRPGLGIPLMLVALSFDVAGRVGGSVTAYQLLLLLTAAAWVLRLVARDEEAMPEFTAVDLGMVALFAAAFWSLPTSLDRADTMVAIVRIGFVYVFYLLCATYLRQKRWMDLSFAVLVGAGAFHSAIAFLQTRMPGLGLGTAVNTLGGDDSALRGSAFFDDPNYLAAMLAAAILVALFKLVASRRWSHATLWAVGAGICLLGLYATFSRTGMVGVAVGLPFVWLVAPKGRKRWVFAALAAAVVIVLLAAPGVIVERFADVAGPSADTSSATRYYMAISTTEIIEDNWVFGTGLSAFDEAYPAYRIAGSNYSVTRPHQLPLALWAEMGIAGIFAQIALTLAAVWVVWTTRRGGLSLEQGIGIALVCSFAVQSLFQYLLYFEYVWYSLAVLVAASMAKKSRLEESHA